MQIWIIVTLMLLGALAILLEVVVPSAGILGVGGVAVIVFAVVQAFRGHSTVVGAAFLASAIVVIPILLLAALKIFPRSWVGRRLILKASESQEEGFVSHQAAGYDHLVGVEGEAVTDLHPSGVVRLEGTKYSDGTSGEYVGRSEPVRVLRTEGSRIVVGRKKSEPTGGD